MQPHAVTAGTISTRLAEFANRAPERMAIDNGHVRVTRAQLDADVTATARQIVAASEGRAGNVALFFEDRIAAVRSIIGAARSGHAYVTLDAADPEERLRFILRDSEPIALLTEPALLDRARALAPEGCPVIDVAHPGSVGESSELPEVDAGAMACLYYTSGSTGKPKGVSQTHVNLQFFVDAYGKRVGIGEGDRISMLYAVSFAAGIGAIYRGMSLGATLCAYDLKRDGIARLADWLDRERITMLHTFPMVFREMARHLGPRRVLPHLRVIHLGGESLFAADVARFRAHTLPHCTLVHQLSASEIAIIAQNVIRHETVVPADGVISVGRPIDGVRIEIRREDGSVAAADEPGEVIACSRHTSPGYWRRPELDAAAFSADLVEPGGRCYRTGDLARIDAAGCLHFLGRVGNRVKIRGYTIDVAEVEAALASCPDVVNGAVVAEGDAAQSASRLCAYVEARPGALRDPMAIKRHLAARLSLHMLPSEIRYVDALPRTAGGKLDRKRLAGLGMPPATPSVVANGDATAPRDATEAAVAHIFKALLKVESVGADDDFFLLGGDSLMGTNLQARLEETFGVRVADFHKASTVAGVAASVRRERTRSPALSRTIPMLVPLRESGGQPPLFIVHGRHGQAYFSPHFMQLLGDEQPVWAFQARGLDGTSEPHRTLEAMAADYVAEVRNVRPHGPYFLGGLCVGAFVAAAMAQSLRDVGEEVLPLLLLDPPNRVHARTEAHADPAHVAGKMRARHAAGRILGPMDDPEYLAASVRTAAAFDEAIARYAPPPYDGPVYVLSSRHRMQLTDPLALRAIFTGRFKRYEVGQTHGHALDARNPQFASTLTRCVGLIRDAARTA
jgi:acyl-coenzyme A synthetase/AMP-(fatty) acid ligase/thioesterase domain-containing protein/acyl carrier protein